MNACQTHPLAGATDRSARRQSHIPTVRPFQPSSEFMRNLRLHAHSLKLLTAFLAGDGTPTRSFESVVRELQTA